MAEAGASRHSNYTTKSQLLQPQAASSKEHKGSIKKSALLQETDKHQNCLEVLPPEGAECSISKVITSNRLNSSAKKAPPLQRIDSTPRHTPTPTKQVTLPSVRRKLDDSHLQVGRETKVAWGDPGLPGVAVDRALSILGHVVNGKEQHDHKPSDRLTSAKDDKRSGTHVNAASMPPRDDTHRQDPVHSNGAENNDDDNDDDDDDDEVIRAPTELMIEFVTTVMQGDYVNAKKLCTMILLYEPNNAEALSFKPLIDEKIALDEQHGAATETSEDEKEDSEDESGSDEEEDSSDDDDDVVDIKVQVPKSRSIGSSKSNPSVTSPSKPG